LTTKKKAKFGVASLSGALGNSISEVAVGTRPRKCDEWGRWPHAGARRLRVEEVSMCQGAPARSLGVWVSHTAVYFGHVPTLCSYFTRELQHAAPSAAAPVDLHTRIKENVPRARYGTRIFYTPLRCRPRAERAERQKRAISRIRSPKPPHALRLPLASA